MIVNKRAIKVTGLIIGINELSYQLLPFSFNKENLVTIPPIKGIPKYINTLWAISPTVILITELERPRTLGKKVMKI